jgi:hypothetical protein
MSIHIVQIGKTKFICGLFWQSLSRPRDLWKEAAQLALKIDADLMVLRKDHAMAQAGYVHTKEGARRGQQSLAAVISKTLAIEGAHYDGHQQPVHNWLCAVKLPDGKWAYCAVRDANFLPNGDFAGTYDDVMERLQGDYALGGWNVVIGDPELEQHGFHNFSARTLDTLLPKRKDGQLQIHTWSALRPVRRIISNRNAIALGAIALMVLIGGGWQLRLKHQKEEQVRERAMQEARQRISAAAATSSKLIPKPWFSKPTPLDFARACVALQDPLTPGGWQLEEYRCDLDHATFGWVRNDSNIDYLRIKVPAAQIALTGNQAINSVPLHVAVTVKEPLLMADVVIGNLLARSQALGLALKLTPPPPVKPVAVKATGQPPAPIPEWKTWALNTELGAMSPVTAAEFLSQAGVRLDRITWHAGSWSIEGVVYAK